MESSSAINMPEYWVTPWKIKTKIDLSEGKTDGIKKTLLEVKLEICSDLHLGLYLDVQFMHTSNYDHT